jgi:hypothetical protein
MSIAKKIEEHVAAHKLYKMHSLELEALGIPPEDTARTMYVSADIIAVVTPPFPETDATVIRVSGMD